MNNTVFCSSLLLITLKTDLFLIVFRSDSVPFMQDTRKSRFQQFQNEINFISSAYTDNLLSFCNT